MQKYLFIIAACFLLAAPARADEALAVDLSADHIDITTGFNGAHLALFGVKQGPGPVVVVLRGPPRDMTVRRKENIAGAWINKAWMNFKDVPVYYDYASSVPLEQVATPAVLKENGIGLAALEFKSGDWFEDKRKDEFRASLIRNNQNAGLFARAPKPVTKISDNFFRVDFYLPANVHLGNYKIQTFYFNGGKVAGAHTSAVRVAQVGMSASVIKFSSRNSFSYGLLCVSFAIFAGWFSNRVRRRA